MNLLAYFILVLFTTSKIVPQEENEKKSGGVAPNFHLENIEGDMIELNEVIGRGPVLLIFWSSFCNPCVESIAAFSKLYNKYKTQGFIMLAISINSQRTVAKVKPYIRSKGYEFPVLLDTNSDVARIYYIWTVPFMVLIDKGGTIIYSHLGYMRGDEIQVNNKVKELLGE